MLRVSLATLNARYSHASLGLRCLRANLAEFTSRTLIHEFTLDADPETVVERLLASAPDVVGLGVYIWNVEKTTRIVSSLKRVAPEVLVVLGGPEVSYETERQRITALADYVITGAGERALLALCREIAAWRDGTRHRPLTKLRVGAAIEDIDGLQLPYEEYSDADIAHRNLYVEASRGCPFKCSFCLSALDRSARAFAPDAFLAALGSLWDRGARRFRFVDRTFNLKTSTSAAILDFFLERLDDRFAVAGGRSPFVHLELVPDRLPDELRTRLSRFPAGVLQFEIGIQSWNPEVQRLVGRRQDNARAQANLDWLRKQTGAHLHVDLIAGLPGEDMTSFAAGFDRLVELDPHEIQVGILKRLRGAPITRLEAVHGLRFQADPPYAVLATDRIEFPDMQRLRRFARYWDLVGNAGRMPALRKRLLGESPFARFMHFADWLYASTDSTQRIRPERLIEAAADWLGRESDADSEDIARARGSDLASLSSSGPRRSRSSTIAPRQARHRQGSGWAAATD